MQRVLYKAIIHHVSDPSLYGIIWFFVVFRDCLVFLKFNVVLLCLSVCHDFLEEDRITAITEDMLSYAEYVI